MTYDDFIEYIKDRANKELYYDHYDFYPEGYRANDPAISEMIKKCNTMYCNSDTDCLVSDFLILSRIGKNRPVGYLLIPTKKLYEYAANYGEDEAFKHIYSSESIPKIPIEKLKETFKDSYSESKERLIIRPLNYEMYKESLSGAVYRRFSDFALVLYDLIDDTRGSISSRKILQDELKVWNMEENQEEIINEALKNTARLFPACVYDTRTDTEIDLLTSEFNRKDVQILGEQILVTTFISTNEAVALFYPGVTKKLMKVMGGAFAAVFMNINDIMIMDIDDPFIDKFAEVGSRTNAMGEMLSKQPFICDETGIHER